MTSSDSEDELDPIRAEIDAIDQKIQSLISERALCAKKIAEIKVNESTNCSDADGNQHLFYRPDREAQVLKKVVDRNEGLLNDSSVAHIFREIMSACLSLERPIQVSYLGPQGTFSQAAAWKHFGHAAKCTPKTTIGEVFSEVELGRSDFGVVPVENSTEGIVSHTLDNLLDSYLKITGEVEVRVEHHLLVSSETREAGISAICAHEQGLAQCRNWLQVNWPEVDKRSVLSNGEAAKLASENVGVAAVAGDIAERQYNLERMSSNIEDRADNTTRFLIIGPYDIPHSGRDKTSILISSRNEPGALYRILEPFQRSDVSLTRLETRPSRTEKWTYIFFIEFEGHLEDDKVKLIMKELEDRSIFLKPLGSYPRSVDY